MGVVCRKAAPAPQRKIKVLKKECQAIYAVTNFQFDRKETRRGS
jgi:hypothetical protein